MSIAHKDGNTWVKTAGTNPVDAELSATSVNAVQNRKVYEALADKAKKPIFLQQTLAAEATTVTFTNLPTEGNYIADFFASNGISYTALDPSVEGQVTLTYEAQSEAVVITCKLEEVGV